MIQFYLVQKKLENASDKKKLLVSGEALPRRGDYVSHDPSGLYGQVNETLFLWDEKGHRAVWRCT